MYTSNEDYELARAAYYHDATRRKMGLIGGISLLAFFAILAVLILIN